MRVQRSTQRQASGDRLVSVILPVYNVGPYLRECVDSVLHQTIEPHHVELIAVNDGSTDDSGEILDDYARRDSRVRVFHQPNSGGPGRPRNIGLDQARGRYVFLMDADDYFGAEALERMVAMAERNGSDVVYGKMVGVAGRRTATRAFRRSRNRAHLTEVYDTLNVMKLFRRSLITDVGVRFDETVAGGEDSPFTAELLLSAHVISVVADYDCYYYRDRPGSQTKRVRTEHPADYLIRMSDRAERLAWHIPPGRERDQLMTRHLRDLLRPFNHRWLDLPADEQRRTFDLGTQLLNAWNTERTQSLLSAPHAVPAYCLQHGHLEALADIVAAPPWGALPAIVEGKRIYLDLPHFRDEYAIPDRYFEVPRRRAPRLRVEHAEVAGGRLALDGTGYLPHLGGETTVVLRRWPWGPAHRYPTGTRQTPQLRDRHHRYPTAGFAADIDLRTVGRRRGWGPGRWQIRMEVGLPALKVETRAKLARPQARTLPRFNAQRPVHDGEPRLACAGDGSLRLVTSGRMNGPAVLAPATAAATRAADGVSSRFRAVGRRLRARWDRHQPISIPAPAPRRPRRGSA